MPPFPVPRLPGDVVDSPDSFVFWLQGLLILLALLPVAVTGVRDFRKGALVGKRRLRFWIYAAFQIVACASVLNWGKAPQIFHFLTSTLGLHAAQILVSIIVLFAGWCVHTLRQWSKLYFGMMQIGFGVVSAVVVVSAVNLTSINLSNVSLAQLVTLLGCVFVIGRGLTDCHEARHPKESAVASDKVTAYP